MSEISVERFVQNGLYLRSAVPIDERVLLETSIQFALNCTIQFLNNNGHPLAAQLLDDQLYERSEQWWREPDQFDGYYKNGQEVRDEIFGKEDNG